MPVQDPLVTPKQEPPKLPKPESATGEELSSAELRSQRLLITGLVVVGLLLLGLIGLLVYMAVNAYQAAFAGVGPSPGEVVMALLRDAAIIVVAFEMLVVGVLMVILILQLRSLVALIQDELKPMMEATNETLATVRGTTQFVSHHVVSPVMKWSSYLAGLRRVVRGVGGLGEDVQPEE